MSIAISPSVEVMYDSKIYLVDYDMEICVADHVSSTFITCISACVCVLTLGCVSICLSVFIHAHADAES